MSAQHQSDSLSRPAALRVVGVASCFETLSRASEFREACDWIEVRADLIGTEADAWLRSRVGGAECPPLLLTIRSAREGGKWGESEAARIERYAALLPFVHAVDIELESDAFSAVAPLAKKEGRLVVGSFHDFHSMPDDMRLRALIERGAAAGADIVKLAVWTATESAVQRLEAILRDPPVHVPLALMGMGPHGAASRLRLAGLGSALVYGFLDAESAPGQLSSAELVKRLSESIPAYRAARAGR